MAKATWNGAVLAQSNETIVVEGNHYCPPDSLNPEYFAKNSKQTFCPWKGQASYYDIMMDGQVNHHAARIYPGPKPAVARIKDHVAFWRGIKVAA